ncbi:MAG TPA: phage portal protein, partial [Alphaproteobacteria bacterium]
MCRPVVRRWIDIGMLAGAIEPPRGMDPRALYRVAWLPQRWAYIHPVQDVQADRDEVRGGLSSRSQKVAQRGYDPAEIDRENAEDNARADALGLAYDSDGRQPRSGGAAKTADAEEREDEREIENA